jgi:hypothetical protein
MSDLNTHKYGNLWSVMATKTTIKIADDLFVAAKRHAAGERTTFRTLVERGLRSELRGAAQKKAPAKIKWVTVDGGLPKGLDIADRAAMTDRLSRR